MTSTKWKCIKYLIKYWYKNKYDIFSFVFIHRFEAEISGTFNLPGFGNIPPPPAPPMMIPHQVKASTKRFDMASHSFIMQPAVVSAKPTLYTPVKPVMQQQTMSNTVDFLALQSEVEKKLKKLKEKVSVPAELAISQGKIIY